MSQTDTPAQEGTSTPRQSASLVVGSQTDATSHRKGHPGRTISPPPDTQSINDEHVTGPSVPTRERTTEPKIEEEISRLIRERTAAATAGNLDSSRLDVSKKLGSYIRYHTVTAARDTEETEGSREEKETTGKDTRGRVLALLPLVNLCVRPTARSRSSTDLV